MTAAPIVGWIDVVEALPHRMCPTAGTWTRNRAQPAICRLTAGLNRPTLGSPECSIVEGAMEKRLLGGGALLVAFCSLASAPLSAQLQTGRLLGTVLDEQHAAVPGATVTVTNLATNIARTVTSDGEGNYVVTPLEPGTYRISASLQGFQTTVRERVELTVGQSA